MGNFDGLSQQDGEKFRLEDFPGNWSANGRLFPYHGGYSQATLVITQKILQTLVLCLFLSLFKL